MIMFYVPCKDRDESRKISKILIEKRLVACTNIVPIESHYVWEEKLCEDNESVLIAKTTEDKEEIVRKEIKGLHSYDVPAILSFQIKANEEYEDWAKKQVK
jgi:periplasmic divalent cation tolerance protein